MKAAMVLGLEPRLLSQRQMVVEGEQVTIPPHWTVLVVLGGVVGNSLHMWSMLPGLVEESESVAGAKRLIKRTLEAFPIDGRDVPVVGRQVQGPFGLRPMRDYHLWQPDPELPEQEVTGRIVGTGIGVEMKGRAYLVPYYGVLVQEEQEGGGTVPRVVPARMFAPFAEEALLAPDDPPLRDYIPELAGHLFDVPFGSHARLQVVQKGMRHYLFTAAEAQTEIACAMREAGLVAEIRPSV